MKLRTPPVLGIATAVVVGRARPASADDTATIFTRTGGDLTLSVGAVAALAPQASL